MNRIDSSFFRMRMILLLLAAVLIIPEVASSQVKTPPGWYHEPKSQSRIRLLLSKIHLEAVTGYNKTYYSHNLEGYGIYQGVNGTRIFRPTEFDGVDMLNSSLTRWFNTSQGSGPVTTDPADYMVSSDTARLRMRSASPGIPISGTLFFFIDQFKIGGGYLILPEFIADFQLIKFPDPTVRYDPGLNFTFARKYYGMVGMNYYRIQQWVFSADVRVGGWKPGRDFNLGQISKGVFVNLGGGFERELSEYFRGFVRPSVEFKSFTLTVPETSGSIKHKAYNLTVNVGALLRLPEKKKCIIKKCQVQIDHLHGDREYRSRMHKIWKKQNPNYGENYPELLRNKRRYRDKEKKKTVIN